VLTAGARTLLGPIPQIVDYLSLLRWSHALRSANKFNIVLWGGGGPRLSSTLKWIRIVNIKKEFLLIAK
jgi:hypothetical protein